jgi:hypothetical protein
MSTMKASALAQVWGTRDSWRLASPGGGDAGLQCEVLLEIQGDPNAGYHLVMSPAGFFTADYWYASQEEAQEAALELFGVTQGQWS